MICMRLTFAALAVGLLLGGTACAGSPAAVQSRGADAAALVPPDAVAFVSADANLDSQQWQRLKKFAGAKDLTAGLDRDGTLQSAVGDQLNLAVLEGEDGDHDVVAFVKPRDEAKLRKLTAGFDHGGKHYTVEKISGWSVVADSKATFDAVRAADSGRSLADLGDFRAAVQGLDEEALAVAYVDGSRLKSVARGAGALGDAVGSARWLAVQLASGGDAIQLDVHAGSPRPSPAVFRPRLLRQVPSGALLAVTFKDASVPLERVAGESSLRRALHEVEEYAGVPLAQLAPALRGEGIIYVVQGILVPTVVLGVESPDPAATAATLRSVAAHLSAKAGNALKLNVVRRGREVFLTNAAAVPSGSGDLLVDDGAFKGALAAADAPEDVAWLAYADLHRLVPVVQALSQVLGGGAPSAQGTQELDHLGTVVAYGAGSGSLGRLSVRITRR
jgi:hypothetical protein